MGGVAGRRWGLRFSLRTLIFFVMALGSVGLVWWDWGPWAPSAILEADGPVSDAQFVGREHHYVWAKRWGAHFGEMNSLPEMVIWDAYTGKRLPWNLQRKVEPGKLSTTGKYIVWGVAGQPQILTRVSDGLQIDLSKAVPQIQTWSLSPGDGYINVLPAQRDRTLLLRLPGMEVVRQFPPPSFLNYQSSNLTERFAPFVSHDEQWVAEEDKGAIAIAKLESGERLQTLPYAGTLSNVIIAPDDKTIALLEEHKDRYGIKVYEIQTGKLVGEITVESAPLKSPNDFIVLVEFSEHGNFLFVNKVQNGTGGMIYFGHFRDLPEVWSLEPGLKKIKLAYVGHDVVNINPTGDLLIASPVIGGTVAWDLKTGEKKWGGQERISCEAGEKYGTNEWVGDSVIEMQTPRALFRVDASRWRGWVPPATQYKIRPQGDDFLMRPEGSTKTSEAAEDPQWMKRVVVWRQRRPVEWWGCFWMWEVWVAGVFAVGLGWSVWRDRRM